MTDAIITDAGFESISYELTTQFFSASDIQYWWTSVAGLDEFEAIELEKQIIQSKADNWQIVQEFLSTFDWLPEKIDVVTARAVFTPAYQWVKVIELGDKQTGEWMSDTYEREAIALGIKLRRHLEDDELLIFNDNKNAVRYMQSPSEEDFLDDEYSDYSDFLQAHAHIVWTPRKNVKQAHKLTIEAATKVIAPDTW